MENKRSLRRFLRLVVIGAVLGVVVYAAWPYLQGSTVSAATRCPGRSKPPRFTWRHRSAGRFKQVHVAEGEHVSIGEDLVDVYSASGMNEEITSPNRWRGAERLIEPGEIAAPGSTLMVVADVNALFLTIYVRRTSMDSRARTKVLGERRFVPGSGL